MKRPIELALSPITVALDHLRARGRAALTSDVIRDLTGSYLVDERTPVQHSSNANVGRFLSRNASTLGIRLLKAHEPILDDQGRKSTSARWAL